MRKNNVQWKSSSEEQNILEAALKENLFINAAQLKINHPLLNKFSDSVLRAHINITKKKLGLDLPGSSSSKLNEESEIKEISGKENLNLSDIPITNEKQNYVSIVNFPIRLECFKDKVTKNEKVIVVAPLFYGVKKVNFELLDDNQTLKIKFAWPTPTFKINELYKKGTTYELDEFHPKYEALDEGLEKIITNLDEVPIGFYEIKLPVQVQSDVSTWKLEPITTADGTRLATIELCGLQKGFTIKKDNVSLTFD